MTQSMPHGEKGSGDSPRIGHWAQNTLTRGSDDKRTPCPMHETDVPMQVEVITASMGNALGSVGGFCVGTEEVGAHTTSIGEC